MKKKKLIPQDVAGRIGVTKMAVSHSLHSLEQVSVTPHGRIAATLDELGYIPNRTPDVLSNAISRAIGTLLPSLANQVSMEVLRRIENITGTHGYQTILAHYSYKPEMEQERLEPVFSWDIDGLILTGRIRTSRASEMIEVAGIPVVGLMGNQSSCLDIAVGFDNSEAACQMIAAITACGHCRTAYLDVRLDRRTVVKQKGCEQAMLDAGLVPCNVMVEQPFSYSSGVELVRQARQEYPQLDGVFCTNDDLAAGAALECQCLGLKIPGGTAIASLHSHDIGQMMGPWLTSVLTPRERIGSIGAERLLVRTRGEFVTSKMLDLGLTLSPGEST